MTSAAKTRITLPDEYILHNAEFRDIETEQDLVDLLLIHWRHVTSTWVVLELRDAERVEFERSSADNSQERAAG